MQGFKRINSKSRYFSDGLNKPYQIEGVLSEIKEELKGKALISIAGRLEL